MPTLPEKLSTDRVHSTSGSLHHGPRRAPPPAASPSVSPTSAPERKEQTKGLDDGTAARPPIRRRSLRNLAPGTPRARLARGVPGLETLRPCRPHQFPRLICRQGERRDELRPYGLRRLASRKVRRRRPPPGSLPPPGRSPLPRRPPTADRRRVFKHLRCLRIVSHPQFTFIVGPRTQTLPTARNHGVTAVFPRCYLCQRADSQDCSSGFVDVQQNHDSSSQLPS